MYPPSAKGYSSRVPASPSNSLNSPRSGSETEEDAFPNIDDEEQGKKGGQALIDDLLNEVTTPKGHHGDGDEQEDVQRVRPFKFKKMQSLHPSEGMPMFKAMQSIASEISDGMYLSHSVQSQGPFEEGGDETVETNKAGMDQEAPAEGADDDGVGLHEVVVGGDHNEEMLEIEEMETMIGDEADDGDNDELIDPFRTPY